MNLHTAKWMLYTINARIKLGNNPQTLQHYIQDINLKLPKLTIKQKVFVEYYLLSLDANQAAKKAGFNERGAGTRLLAKPYIAECVGLAIEYRMRRIQVTQDDVVNELCKMGFSNMEDYTSKDAHGGRFIDLSETDRDQMAAVKKIKTKEYKEGRGEYARDVQVTEFELYDKISTLKMIGQHLGMFNDPKKVEMSGPDGDPIPITTLQLVPIQRGTFFDVEPVPESTIQLVSENPEV